MFVAVLIVIIFVCVVVFITKKKQYKQGYKKRFSNEWLSEGSQYNSADEAALGNEEKKEATNRAIFFDNLFEGNQDQKHFAAQIKQYLFDKDYFPRSLDLDDYRVATIENCVARSIGVIDFVFQDSAKPFPIARKTASIKGIPIVTFRENDLSEVKEGFSIVFEDAEYGFYMIDFDLKKVSELGIQYSELEAVLQKWMQRVTYDHKK